MTRKRPPRSRSLRFMARRKPCVRSQPSRFGSVERLFAAYDYCVEHGIGAYGGGQWELGPGRGQIQLLASLFHPGTPNDVAPREFNLEPLAGLPTSPLPVRPRTTGFLAPGSTGARPRRRS
jgi:hypothetical protein